MKRRSFLHMIPGIWVALGAMAAGAVELATAHLRIDGMT